MKQDFSYNGPATSFAFCEGGKVIWEGTAHSGQVLSGLPVDHPHVQALIAAGHISRADAGAAVAEPVSDVGGPARASKKGKEE